MVNARSSYKKKCDKIKIQFYFRLTASGYPIYKPKTSKASFYKKLLKKGFPGFMPIENYRLEFLNFVPSALLFQIIPLPLLLLKKQPWKKN